MSAAPAAAPPLKRAWKATSRPGRSASAAVAATLMAMSMRPAVATMTMISSSMATGTRTTAPRARTTRPGQQRRSEHPAGPEPFAHAAADRIRGGRADQRQREQEAETSGREVQGPLDIDGRHRPAAPEDAEEHEDPSDGAQVHDVVALMPP